MIHLIKKFVNGQNPANADFKTLDQMAQDIMDLQYLADLSTFGAAGIFGKDENLSILEKLIERKKSLLSDENVRDIVKMAMVDPNEIKCEILNALSENTVAINKMANGEKWKAILSESAFEAAASAKEAIIGKKLESGTLADWQYIFTTPAIKSFIDGKPSLIDKIYESDAVLARVIGNNIWDIPNLTKKVLDNGDALWDRVKAINDTNKFHFQEQTSSSGYFNQGSTMQQIGVGNLAYLTEVKNVYQGNQNPNYSQIQHIDLYKDPKGTKRLAPKITISSSSVPVAIKKWITKYVYYTCTHENPSGSTQGFMQINQLYCSKRIYGKGGWS